MTSKRYPRLNERGQEVLDPNPKVIYARVDPDTGEVLQEGRPRPKSLEMTLQQALGRGYYDLHDGSDDDDFDIDEDDGSLPLHTPHTEGFVDAMGDTPQTAAKKALKSGSLRLKKKESGSSKKLESERQPIKAGEDSSPEDSD